MVRARKSSSHAEGAASLSLYDRMILSVSKITSGAQVSHKGLLFVMERSALGIRRNDMICRVANLRPWR